MTTPTASSSSPFIIFNSNPESVLQHMRQTARRMFEAERDKVLSLLPDAYKDRFGAIGFYEGHPVLIVSPYDDVPPGPLRTAYMDRFEAFRSNDQLHDMPFLVYQYDSSTTAATTAADGGGDDGINKNHKTGDALDDCYLLISPQDLVEYETGVREHGLGRIPRHIEQRILLEGVSVLDNLSPDDQELLRPLQQVEQDLKQSPESRRRGWASTDFQEAYECLTMDYTPTTRSRAAQSESESSADKKNNNNNNNNANLCLPSVNTSVGVWWPRDRVYYPATVTRRRGDFGYIEYDDGDKEWLLLKEHKFKLLIDEDGDADWLHKSSPASAASTGTATTSSSMSPWGAASPPPTELVVRPKKLPRQLEDGTFAKPSGRSPIGMKWDGHVGAWTPTRTRSRSAAATDTPQQQQQQQNFPDAGKELVRPKEQPRQLEDGTYAVPMGHRPKGMTWDCHVGAWKPAATPAALDSPQQQQQQQQQQQKDPDSEKEFIQPKKLPRQLEDGTFAKPSGRAPTGMTWDGHVGAWTPTGTAAIDTPQKQKQQRQQQNDPDAGKEIVRPKKLPRRLEDGTFAKPSGRGPAGMKWDGHVGAWTPTGTAATDTPHQQEQLQQNDADAGKGFVRSKVQTRQLEDGTYAVPMGRRPTGMTWDCHVGAWKPAASLATLDSPQQQNVPDVGKEFIRPNELLQKPDGTYSVPKGPRPSGMTWDRHVGVWKPKSAAKRKLVAVKDGSASKKRKASQDKVRKNDAAEQPQPLTVKAVLPIKSEEEQALLTLAFYKEDILSCIPATQQNLYGTVGFDKDDDNKPVLVLSPFDVEDGEAAAEWFAVYEQKKTKGTLDKMPLVVKRYGPLSTCSDDGSIRRPIGLVKASNLIPWGKGKELGYDMASEEIVEKISAHQQLTVQEECHFQAVLDMRKEHNLPLLPEINALKKDEDEKIVGVDVEQPLDPRVVVKNIMVALKKEVPGRSDESMHRCQNMLDKLNSIDMSMEILEDNQEIIKYIEELRAYTPLKPSASPLKKKWRNVYNTGIETKLASVVEDWRKSAEEGNAVRVHESVSKLLQLVEHYELFTKSFVEVHGMVDLMNTTYELLTEHEMDLTDYKKLYQIVLENVSL